jgi:hypothetical protein
MMFDREKLERLRAKFGEAGGKEIFDPHFRAVADSVFKDSDKRPPPYAGDRQIALSSIGDRAVSIAVRVGLRALSALRPQHGQAPCAPCAELQLEVGHTAACSHLLCTARMELELGDACHTQPALGRHSSDTNPSPCYSSRMLRRPNIRDVARV